MPDSLRCIIDDSNNAAFNMAADLYLMQLAAEQKSIFLRLYQWMPPAISIGSLQHASRQLDLARCQRDGINWIRRPTGGRAVLHKEDLTYSLIFTRDFQYAGTSVASTYAIIMKCLVNGLVRLGISPEVHDTIDPLVKSGRHVKLPCFLAPNRNEIMIDGRKLVGSAQYRNKDAVLQHGSLPISSAPMELPRYLQLSPEEQEQQSTLMRQKSIVLSELLPAVTGSEVIDALKNGFGEGLAMPITVKPFTREERRAIEEYSAGSTFIQKWCKDPE